MRHALPLTVLLLLPCPAADAGQTVQTEVEKLVASDAGPGDDFGRAVAASGVRALVGARGHDDGGDAAGAAYVYREAPGGWVEEAVLLAADAAPGDEFGAAVTLAGDFAVVGAPRDDDAGNASGAAYVFRRTGTTWTQEAKLVPADGAALDFFGWSVAAGSDVHGDAVLVGAPGDDDAGGLSGAAYVYRFDGAGWSLEQKLVGWNALAGDSFGAAVALSGTVAVCGAWGDDIVALDVGAAYVYRFDGASWNQEQYLFASDGAKEDLFGGAVAVRNDVLVVGSDHDDDFGTESGAVYVFRHGGGVWTQEQKLTPADAKFADNFGYSVDVCGDVIAVGSIGHDDAGLNSGSAYAFVHDGRTWNEAAKLAASDAAGADEFGSDVAVSGDVVLSSARLDDDGGPGSGSVYRFAGLAPDPWTDLGAGLTGTAGIPLLTGAGALCGGDALTVSLTSARPSAPAFLVMGFGTLFVPLEGGTLVPTLDLIVPLATSPAGTLVISDVFPVGAPAGLGFHLQYWITDPLGPSGWAASNGLVGTTP